MKKLRFTREWLFGFSANVAGVIIGIVLTFGITFFVQHRQERRQTMHILSMVRDELKKNLAGVEMQKKIFESELASAFAIKPYIQNPRLVPLDTLEKYGSTLISVRFVGFPTDSFEVLKNSPQIQTLEDKEFLREIFSIYDAIGVFDDNITSIYRPKSEMVSESLSALDSDTYDRLWANDEFRITAFAELVKNRHYAKYIIDNTHGADLPLLIPEAEDIMVRIEEVIDRIDKEIQG